MATLNEALRISDVLLMEEGEEMNFVRDAITVLSGTAVSPIGQIMGKITLGAAVVAAAGAGGGGSNTGNGTCVIDATTPLLASAKAGVYSLKCTVAGTNSATFRLSDPDGRVLADYSFTGAGASFTTGDQVKAAVTDAATDFVVGDGFSITVAAGSGKYVQVNPSAVDGSQNAAGVLLVKTDATAADKSAVAVVRGPAIIKTSNLSWTGGMTTPQKTTALAQLAALGITARTDYGV